MRRTSQEHKKFNQHRLGAKKRNIDFNLTFDEWYMWWIFSGHYTQRGRGKDQYVMARFNDKGAYGLGNIKCITSACNVSEAFNHRSVSDITKQRMSDSRKGVKKSEHHKIKLRENLSISHKNHQKKVETPDGIFESIKNTGDFYKITPEAVSWRCKQIKGQFIEWKIC